MAKTSIIYLALVLIFLPASVSSKVDPRRPKATTTPAPKLELQIPEIKIRDVETEKGYPKSPRPQDKPLKEDKPEVKKPAKGKVIIEFTEGDIKELVKVFSEILGKNFTYDDSIKGQVTLIGAKEVTKWQAKRIFEAALGMMGYTVVWGWPINKIVPLSKAKSAGNVPVIY